MTRFSWGCALGALWACVAAGPARAKSVAPALGKIKDAKIWSLINGDVDAGSEEGKTVVRLRPKADATTPSNIGLALVEGLELGEGTIELDLKGRGPEEASFVGVAFGVADANTFEAVYFRPFNFMRDGMKDGEPSRSHAVQYVAWPDHTWEKLRKGKPLTYESAVKPIPDPSGWFHARVEVTKQKVSVWVDGGKEPCLVVDRLGSRNKGKVGLWVDSQEGAFRDLKIRSR
jgi:hypothetical protein